MKDKIVFKKNQDIHLTIEDFTREGEGLGKVHGFPFFVKDTVIGDVAVVTVTKVKKNYGYARLKKVLVPSPDRVEPPCPVARQCGGCRIQQLSYDRQLAYKFDQVAGCLQRIGGFEEPKKLMEPILGMDEPWHYRNKAQFPVGRDRQGKLVAGFYAGRTHTIVPNTDCLIQAPVNKEILELILAHMEKYRIAPYDEGEHRGLVRHVLTRVGYHTGQIMVCLVLNGTADQFPGLRKLAGDLSGIKGMTSLIVNSNTDRTNRIMGNLPYGLGAGLYRGYHRKSHISDRAPLLFSGESQTDRGALWQGLGVCGPSWGRDSMGPLLRHRNDLSFSGRQGQKGLWCGNRGGSRGGCQEKRFSQWF